MPATSTTARTGRPRHADFVVDEARFEALHLLFDALRVDKEEVCFRGYEEWLAYLDPAARAWLWWPSADELDRAAARWDFGSLVDAIRNGRYALVACERLAPGRGRLAWVPEPGAEEIPPELRALVEAFGGSLG